MAKIVDPNAKEVCVECLKHNIRRPAVRVIYVETGDVDKQRIPLCEQHFEELRSAVQGLENLMDKNS